MQIMRDGVVVINQLGIIQSFNSFAESIFGYIADEVIGKNINILMNTFDKVNHDGYLEKYLDTGKKNIIDIPRIVDGVKKDGTQVSIFLSVSELRLNGVVLFTGIIRYIEDEDASDKAYHNRLCDNLQEIKTLTQHLKQGSEQWEN